MKLIVDENISFGKDAFSEFGEITFAHGREINNKMLADADALITRSITKVNEELLSGKKEEEIQQEAPGPRSNP